MRLGYNTNGFAHHDLFDTLEVLDRLGYQSVAITIDHHALSPADVDWREQLARLRGELERRGMRSVIETGARYLLDPWTKHEPTLLTADAAQRARRVTFYRHALDCAAALGSDCVSLWSGILREPIERESAYDRLAAALAPVLDHAARVGVPVGFEPEPGMFIDTMASFAELVGRIESPQLRLTLDLGHLHCLAETPLEDQIRRWQHLLVNVHLEDMRRGVHEHLMFGEGEIDFPPLVQTLREVGYGGGVHVELSRHAHDASQAARRAMEFLRPLFT